jgi:hypothetical protein
MTETSIFSGRSAFWTTSSAGSCGVILEVAPTILVNALLCWKLCSQNWQVYRQMQLTQS